MTRACGIAGLTDFGDLWFVKPFETLVDFLNREANLITMECSSVDVVRGFLVDRLRLVEYLKKHPEVRDEKVNVGGIVVGMPRGGSTLTQRLFCSSPQITAPYFWELMIPFPLPGEKPGDPSRRIAQTEENLNIRSREWPGFTGIHPTYATAYDEESFLISRSFLSVDFIFYFHIPNYIRWLRKQDQGKAFSELKLWLQVLQHQMPSRRNQKWLLKTGHYIWSGGLRAILRTFPDATAFVTHRSLENVIPSCCSLQNVFFVRTTRHFDPKVLGPEVIQLYRDALFDLIEVRAEAGARFVDFQYEDLVRDPLKQYRCALTAMGLTPGPLDETACLKWIDESRRDTQSRHTYTPEDYGLTRAQITDAFNFYTDRFLPPA
jgi:hypothetical protein